MGGKSLPRREDVQEQRGESNFYHSRQNAHKPGDMCYSMNMNTNLRILSTREFREGDYCGEKCD
jgi:hypothetical protein